MNKQIFANLLHRQTLRTIQIILDREQISVKHFNIKTNWKNAISEEKKLSILRVEKEVQHIRQYYRDVRLYLTIAKWCLCLRRVL